MIKKFYKIIFFIIIILVILTLNSYARYKATYRLTAYKIKVNNQNNQSSPTVFYEELKVPEVSKENSNNNNNKGDFIIEIYK